MFAHTQHKRNSTNANIHTHSQTHTVLTQFLFAHGAADVSHCLDAMGCGMTENEKEGEMKGESCSSGVDKASDCVI